MLASSQASAGGNGSIIHQPIYNNPGRRVSGSTGLNDVVSANEVICDGNYRQHSYELDEEVEHDASGMRAVNAAIVLGGSSATAEPGTRTDRDVARIFESPLQITNRITGDAHNEMVHVESKSKGSEEDYANALPASSRRVMDL